MHPIDQAFLKQFPGGLQDDLWLSIGKKHNAKKIIEIYDNELSKANMEKLIKEKKFDTICELTLIIVKKTTIISVFEKVAFQNFIGNEPIRENFSKKLYQLLYNFSEESFSNMVDVLLTYKGNKNSNAAKWPVVTAFNAVKYQNEHIFVKPTTVKANSLLLKKDIEYKSLPNFNTYIKILEMVKEFRDKSDLCKNESLMITQAVLFCVSSSI